MTCSTICNLPLDFLLLPVYKAVKYVLFMFKDFREISIITTAILYCLDFTESGSIVNQSLGKYWSTGTYQPHR